jgi:hypothetical protein
MLSAFWSQAQPVLARGMGEDSATSPLTHRLLEHGTSVSRRRARRGEYPGQSLCPTWRVSRPARGEVDPRGAPVKEDAMVEVVEQSIQAAAAVPPPAPAPPVSPSGSHGGRLCCRRGWPPRGPGQGRRTRPPRARHAHPHRPLRRRAASERRVSVELPALALSCTRTTDERTVANRRERARATAGGSKTRC